MKNKFFWTFLISLAILSNGFSKDTVKIIYPNGVPKIQNYFTTKSQNAVFKILDTIGNKQNETFVLFCLFIKLKSEDDLYKVFLAKIKNSKLVYSAELTDSIDNFQDFPGNFSEFGAKIQKVFSDEFGLFHICIWSQISGNGRGSSSKDLFFLEESDTLKFIYGIKKLSSFGKGGLNSYEGSIGNIFSLVSGEKRLVFTQKMKFSREGSLKKIDTIYNLLNYKNKSLSIDSAELSEQLMVFKTEHKKWKNLVRTKKEHFFLNSFAKDLYDGNSDSLSSGVSGGNPDKAIRKNFDNNKSN